MLANQNMLIETMQANHRHIESLLSLMKKLSTKANVPDVAEECEHLREVLKDTDTLFGTLRDASTSDLTSFLNDVKRYAADVVSSESRELQAMLTRRSQAAESDLNDRFKKLEARVLSELATSGDAAELGGRPGTRSNDSQLLKKVTNRLVDFEGQVASQLQAMSQDIEKKVAFLSSSRTVAGFDSTDLGSGIADRVIRDLDGVKYDIGELKDLLNSQKGDTAHVKRIVLACERDMEDFTAAMDAVNVDLDEMRARVDSTHSIITSRQRVEATVTAEISTMRLDMGDMQEALKAHDAWMEDVSQSLQEAHERCHQLSEDIRETRDQTQAKLDAKTDLVAWNDMNDDIDASIKTVRDMASALRLEVDSRRRKVDDSFSLLKQELTSLEAKTDSMTDHTHRIIAENQADILLRCEDRVAHGRQLEETMHRHADIHTDFELKMKLLEEQAHQRLIKLDEEFRATTEAATRDLHERVDRAEQAHASSQKDVGKRMNALDLRISGLQGATGEGKRDISKLRDEVNSLTVKSAAHDVDIGQNSDDIRKLDRQRAEDNQRHKQDMDAVYEELDQKVYEKSFQSLEDNTTKLTRGVVKLCQVVGVFPGARMNDGSDEDLDVDVELLNWEDCAQNLVARVEKTWRQASSQKFRSVLDLVSKKADHSVLRLLQISQQHIESQLDRVRHERELWKEVVDKRTQQPLQLALTLKDPHTGMPLVGPGGFMPPQGITLPQAQLQGMGQYASIRPLSEDRTSPMSLGMTQGLPGSAGEQPGGAMKPSPLAKRITNVNTAPTRLDSARKQA